MEIIGGLVSEWLPTKVDSLDMSQDGETVKLSASGTGEMTSTLLRDQEGNGFTLRGGGFVGGFGLEEAHLAPTASQWGDAEMPIDTFETKSGARGEFAWAA